NELLTGLFKCEHYKDYNENYCTVKNEHSLGKESGNPCVPLRCCRGCFHTKGLNLRRLRANCIIKRTKEPFLIQIIRIQCPKHGGGKISNEDESTIRVFGC